MEDETITLLKDTIANQKKNYKTLAKVLVILVVLYTVILCFMICGFFIYESQFEYTDTYTLTEDIDQSVEGDDATINNVRGNQYNDNAVHNEGE